MKILVVEDDFISRKLLQAILAPHGICEVAVNGKEAIEMFKASIDDPDSRYDLICLDIMMPEMDGHEVLKKIREIEAEKNILGLAGVKIIMVTALGDFDNIKTAFKNQCEAYIVKPIDRVKLLDTMKDLGLPVKG